MGASVLGSSLLLYLVVLNLLAVLGDSLLLYLVVLKFTACVGIS